MFGGIDVKSYGNYAHEKVHENVNCIINHNISVYVCFLITLVMFRDCSLGITPDSAMGAIYDAGDQSWLSPM